MCSISCLLDPRENNRHISNRNTKIKHFYVEKVTHGGRGESETEYLTYAAVEPI